VRRQIGDGLAHALVHALSHAASVLVEGAGKVKSGGLWRRAS
jgi:hypothetical protein